MTRSTNPLFTKKKPKKIGCIFNEIEMHQAYWRGYWDALEKTEEYLEEYLKKIRPKMVLYSRQSSAARDGD